MPEHKAGGYWQIQRLRCVALHDGDHTSLTNALPWKAQHQGVELCSGQRRVGQRGPNDASLMKLPGAQPDADPVVYEHLESITTAVGKDVGVVWLGSAEDCHHAAQRRVGPGTHVHRLHGQP